MLTLGYFADGPWSHRALDLLLADPELRVAFICARDDHPDPVLRQVAGEHHIPFLTHPRVNSREFRTRIAEFGCDLFVSMSFNQIFKRRLIELPPLKTINCHAGALPFYRGRNVLNWALINDAPSFGVTVHYMDVGIDTGDIILTKHFPISDEDTYATLLQRAYPACAEVLYEAITQVRQGAAARIDQTTIHPVGFYCPQRGPGDENLNWDQPSRDVFNFVRAICDPGPQARTWLGEHEILINRVALIPDAPVYTAIPGAVVGVDADSFVVKTRDTTVRVLEWTAPTKIRIGARLS